MVALLRWLVEYAPAAHGGWQWAPVGFGLAAGMATTAALGAALPPAALSIWGWRLPFIAALPLGLIGLYVRARLEETPAFRALEHGGVVSRVPIVEAMKTARRNVRIGFGTVAAVAVNFNAFYVFLPSYLAAQGRVAVEEAFGSALAGLILGSIVAPLLGRVSDRVGRRPVLIAGVVGCSSPPCRRSR